MLKSFSFSGSYRKLYGIEGFSGIRDHEAEKRENSRKKE
jgi:hypothetical protein